MIVGSCTETDDPRIAGDVAVLAVGVRQVRRHDLPVLDTDPDDRDVRATVRVERDVVPEVRAGKEGLDGLPLCVRLT